MNQNPEFTDDEFTDEELAAAFRGDPGHPQASEEPLEQLRLQLLERTQAPKGHTGRTTAFAADSGDSPGREFGLSWRLATLAALILIAVMVIRPFVGTAAASLNSALDATRQETWIHATTLIERRGVSVESQSWCSPQHRIAAFRSPQRLHFVNYQDEIQASYSSQSDAIYLWRADRNFENFGRTFVNALLNSGDLKTAFPFHTVSEVARTGVTVSGQSRMQYSFELKLKTDPLIRWNTIVQTDRPSGRIVLWEEHHAGGMNIVTTFDYPASGPRDIYELGASANAKVVDRVASSDVVRLAEQFQQQVSRFGNYEALVIDEWQSEDRALTGPVLLRRLWRSGKMFRVDLLTPVDADVQVPDDADLAWWKANRDSFTSTRLAECNGETCTLYPARDSRLDLATEMMPRVQTPSTIPIVSLKSAGGFTSIPIWPSIWPEYTCRPMLMTSDPTLRFDVDPSGTDGPSNTLRLRLLAPDSPFTKERASYWLSLDDDHCVVRSTVMQPVFEGFTGGPFEKQISFEYSDFGKSPGGITYAATKLTVEAGVSKLRRTRFILDFDSTP